MFVFAQLSTSVSDDQIRLIIIALLVVAVLLAALTVWFFVKTSPSRRVRAAQARRSAAAPSRSGVDAGASARPAQARPGASAASRPVQAAVAVDDDDEWERLTAPEPRRPTGS